MSKNDPVSRPRALLLYGGWEGHTPAEVAAAAERVILPGFDVTPTGDLGVLERATLETFDLLVPVWTFGELSEQAERALLGAVEDGLGVLAWHGFTSAFLHSRALKHLAGGQFVCHPGGDSTTYQVHFDGDDPLVDGLEPLTLTSEQYYMLVDPAVKVLATTAMVGEGMPWLAGVQMPVAWTRGWGDGRVFYCSLGHTADIVEIPQMTTLLRRAAWWATRGRKRERGHGQIEASMTLKATPAGVRPSD